MDDPGGMSCSGRVTEVKPGCCVRSDLPICEDRGSPGRFDLLSEALTIERQERIMGCIGRAAQRVSRQHYPISKVNRAEHSRQDAHIRFGTGNDQRVRAAFP